MDQITHTQKIGHSHSEGQVNIYNLAKTPEQALIRLNGSMPSTCHSVPSWQQIYSRLASRLRNLYETRFWSETSYIFKVLSGL
jgi:hypothetical protein